MFLLNHERVGLIGMQEDLLDEWLRGDKGRGFVVKFVDGRIQNMNEAKLEELDVLQNTVVGNRMVESYDGG